MDTKNEMLTLLRGRRRGYSLDRPFYTDSAYFRVDLELIWYRDWLFVGHDCELPKPGHFFTVQVGEYPVVVVRDRDGRIRAFHNSCRHRGSRVCTAERGSNARLVCPYHQWTYDLDGTLLFARNMGERFDAAGHALKSVACRDAGGYIFICLADEPMDFEAFRAVMMPYFGPHRLADAKVAYESTIIEKGNWKLVWENNRECYHCAGSHPELCRTYPESATTTGVDATARDPAMAGLASRLQLDAHGQYRATRAPLLGDSVSFTLSGDAAVRRPLSDAVTASRIGALMLFHYPSTWNHVLADHAVTFRVLPISATETAVTTKWLVHRDAVDGVDYDIETLTHVWTRTNDQDRRLVAENARGIGSPAYEPGPYNEQDEDGVVQFVDWYSSTIETRLTRRDVRTLRRVA